MVEGEFWEGVSDSELMEEARRRGLTVGYSALSFALGEKVADEGLLDQLEPIPTEYRNTVFGCYLDTKRTTANRIRQGLLPEAYRMPEVTEFVDEVIALAPARAGMIERNWRPSMAFIPQGLTTEQWHNLLVGQPLPGGSIAQGIKRKWSDEEIFDPTAPAPRKGLWELIVISGGVKGRGAIVDTSMPALTGVSPNGKSGSRAEEVIRKLQEFREEMDLPVLTSDEFSEEELLISQLSPSREMWWGYQLKLLDRGLKLIDDGTWTIGKEKLFRKDGVKSIFFDLFGDLGEFNSEIIDSGYSSGDGGVRPSVRASDLVQAA